MWRPSWCSSICCYNMIRNFRSSTEDWPRWTTVFLFYIFLSILWCSFWSYFISNYFWDLMQQPWLFIWILEQLLFLQVLIKRKSIKDIKDALWESLLTIFSLCKLKFHHKFSLQDTRHDIPMVHCFLRWSTKQSMGINNIKPHTYSRHAKPDNFHDIAVRRWS